MDFVKKVLKNVSEFIMPVPKGRNSKQRRNKRSANKGLKPKAVATCQTCQAPVLPHQVCFECGRYKGVKVVRTKADRMHERGQARRELEAKKMASQGVKPQEESVPPAKEE
jgi:large subunit ribosomal protein L32